MTSEQTSSPEWSPDGTKLTFSSNRATAGTTNGQEIYVMGSANGNSQVRLTTIVGDDVAPYYFDANRIVFASAKAGTRSPGWAHDRRADGRQRHEDPTASGDATPG